MQFPLSSVIVVFQNLFGSSALPHLHVPQNLCKADDTVVQISELIEEDAAANGLFKKALYANVMLQKGVVINK